MDFLNLSFVCFLLISGCTSTHISIPGIQSQDPVIGIWVRDSASVTINPDGTVSQMQLGRDAAGNVYSTVPVPGSWKAQGDGKFVFNYGGNTYFWMYSPSQDVIYTISSIYSRRSTSPIIASLKTITADPIIGTWVNGSMTNSGGSEYTIQFYSNGTFNEAANFCFENGCRNYTPQQGNWTRQTQGVYSESQNGSGDRWDYQPETDTVFKEFVYHRSDKSPMP